MPRPQGALPAMVASASSRFTTEESESSVGAKSVKSTGALAAAQLAVAGSERRGGRGLHSKAGQRLTRQPDLLMRTTTLRKQGLSGSKSQPSGLTLEAIGAARSKTGPAFSPAHPPSRDRSPSERGPARRGTYARQAASGWLPAGTRLGLLPPSLSASQQPSRDAQATSRARRRRWCVVVDGAPSRAAAERGADADREQEEATADGFRDPSEDLELAGLVAPSGASGDLTSRRTEFSACATVTVDSRGGELGRLEDERSSLIGGDERSSCRASCRGQRSSVAGEGSKSRGAMSLASPGGSTLGIRSTQEVSSEIFPRRRTCKRSGTAMRRRPQGVDPSIRDDDRATSFGTSCRDSARPSSVARHSFRVSFVGGAGGAPARVLDCR